MCRRTRSDALWRTFAPVRSLAMLFMRLLFGQIMRVRPAGPGQAMVYAVCVAVSPHCDMFMASVTGDGVAGRSAIAPGRKLTLGQAPVEGPDGRPGTKTGKSELSRAEVSGTCIWSFPNRYRWTVARSRLLPVCEPLAAWALTSTTWRASSRAVELQPHGSLPSPTVPFSKRKRASSASLLTHFKACASRALFNAVDKRCCERPAVDSRD
jgi:hypothetical protein